MSTPEVLNNNKPLHIQILEEKDFNKLPFDYVEDSLGLADYKKGKAYIKKTGIPALDLLTIGHELEELTSTLSPHEINGIRYKSGGQTGSWLAPLVGGLLTVFSGGTLAPLGMLIGGLGSIGTSQYSKSKKPDKYGKTGKWGDILTSGGTGALGAYGVGQLGTGGVAGWKAAQAGGQGLLGKMGGALQGGLWGTGTSMGGDKFSLLGKGGSGMGLLGQNTPAMNFMGSVGNMFGGTGGSSSLGNFLPTMAQSMLTPKGLPSKQLPLPPMTIQPRFSPATPGGSSYEKNYNYGMPSSYNPKTNNMQQGMREYENTQYQLPWQDLLRKQNISSWF